MAMNPQRLTNTFQRMRASLKSVALRITGSDPDADDILQDAFVRLWGGKDLLPDDVRLEGYLSRAVRNSAVDAVRKRRVTVGAENAETDSLREEPPPDVESIYNEVSDIMERELPPLQREVMKLRDIEQLDFKEISCRLGIPEATARVYLSRARAAVRKIYRKRNE